MSTKPKDTNDGMLIWDCDPGCDDALAIAYVLTPRRCRYKQIDFLTVTGNVHVEQTTANARRMVALCKQDWHLEGGNAFPTCKVFRGASRSLIGEEPSASSVHGRDGLGNAPNNMLGCELDVGNLPPLEERSAVERYLELARKEFVFELLVTGPLTNLAVAFTFMQGHEVERFWANCRKMVVMGGNFASMGNITPSAEFNFHADPVAAQMVLSFYKEASVAEEKTEERKAPTLYFVPLDITERVGLDIDGSVGGKNAETAKARFLRYALKEYGSFHAFSARRPDKCKGFDGVQYAKAQLLGSTGVSKLNRFCHLHDPVAAWVLLEEKLESEDLGWKEMEIRIDQSQGESRGRVIDCSPKEGLPYAQPTLGAGVKWLSEIAKEIVVEELVPQLMDLIGLEELKENCQEKR